MITRVKVELPADTWWPRSSGGSDLGTSSFHGYKKIEQEIAEKVTYFAPFFYPGQTCLCALKTL